MRTIRRRATVALAVALALPVGPLVSAQQPIPDTLEVVQVRPNFYMIAGAGGNVAVQLGPIGAVVVDTGSEAMAAGVLAAIKRLTNGSIRYIINTGSDSDHTGGNERLSKSGKTILGSVGSAGVSAEAYTNGGAASVLAHEDVLARMSGTTPQERSVAAALWPSKTYSGKSYSMTLNGDGIQVLHTPAAHSDGDSVVFFHRADVIVAGDILDTTRFPVVDTARGGSIQGEIDALTRILDLTVPPFPLAFQEDRTYVVPGHGFLCDFYDVVEYRSVLIVIRDRIADLKAKGMTLAQVRGTDPTKGFRERYGTAQGPWTTDMFVEAVYSSLPGARTRR